MPRFPAVNPPPPPPNDAEKAQVLADPRVKSVLERNNNRRDSGSSGNGGDGDGDGGGGGGRAVVDPRAAAVLKAKADAKEEAKGEMVEAEITKQP